MSNEASEIMITVDRRPLAVVLLSRFSRVVILAFLAVVFYFFVTSTPWEGLSVEGFRAIGIFFLCTILWLFQLIPMSITGLLALVLIPLLGVLPSREAYGYFGNEAVFFILGAFILSAAMMQSGLSARLAIFFLKFIRLSPKKLVLGILVTTSFLSCVMSEHAVAAFCFPIVLEICKAMTFVPKGGEYGKTLFLAMAWGCIIGGIVTLLGGARAPLALGILYEITGSHIGFFEWMKTTVWVAAPLFAVASGLLVFYFKTDVASIKEAHDYLVKKSRALGLVSLNEVLIFLILLGAIYFWVSNGEASGMAAISIMAVVLIFVLGLVRWKEISENINWGIILMYGGAIALGRAVDASGALEWLAPKILIIPEGMADKLGGSPIFWLLVILSFSSVFLTELFSNSAVVALLLPISIKMAISLESDPTAMTYAIAIPAGLGFIMPMGTPAIALAYSSGYLKVKEIALPGLILNLSGWIFFVLVVKFLWPLMGIKL